MPFNYDSTGVELANGFEPLPEGYYPLKIVEAEEKKSSKGNDMIEITCDVFNDPRFNGKELMHWVTFLPPKNPDGTPNKGAGMSVHFRKCIGVPWEGNVRVDSSEWLGKKFMAKVIVEEYSYTDKKGKPAKGKRNKIKSVEPMDVKGFADLDKSDDSIPF